MLKILPANTELPPRGSSRAWIHSTPLKWFHTWNGKYHRWQRRNKRMYVFFVIWCLSAVASLLPPFGSHAAGPACDGAVYVGKVGVIARIVLCANLQITTRGLQVNSIYPHFESCQSCKYTNWPLGDVIRPLVRGNWGWLHTNSTKIKARR